MVSEKCSDGENNAPKSSVLTCKWVVQEYATGKILRTTQHIHDQVDFFSRTDFGTNYLRTYQVLLPLGQFPKGLIGWVVPLFNLGELGLTVNAAILLRGRNSPLVLYLCNPTL